MAEIGLVAKVTPEVDERQAGKQAGKLRSIMQDAVDRVELNIDQMEEVVERAEQAAAEMQSLSDALDGADPSPVAEVNEQASAAQEKVDDIMSRVGGSDSPVNLMGDAATGIESAPEIDDGGYGGMGPPDVGTEVPNILGAMEEVEDSELITDGGKLMSEMQETDKESLTKLRDISESVSESADLPGVDELQTDGPAMDAAQGTQGLTDSFSTPELSSMRRDDTQGPTLGNDGGLLGRGMEKLDEISSGIADNAAASGMTAKLLRSGGAATAIAGIALFSLLAIMKGVQALKESSPLLSQVFDIFFMALKLFLRPFGNLLAKLLLPIVVPLLHLATQFNKLYSENGLGVALLWLGEEVIKSLAGAIANAVSDILKGEGTLGDFALLAGAGLGAKALASRIGTIGLASIISKVPFSSLVTSVGLSTLVKLVPSIAALMVGIATLDNLIEGDDPITAFMKPIENLGELITSPLGIDNNEIIEKVTGIGVFITGVVSIISLVSGVSITSLVSGVSITSMIGSVSTGISGYFGTTAITSLVGGASLTALVGSVASIGALIYGMASLGDLVDGEISDWNLPAKFGEAMGEGFQNAWPNMADKIHNAFTNNPVHGFGEWTGEALRGNRGGNMGEPATQSTSAPGPNGGYSGFVPDAEPIEEPDTSGLYNTRTRTGRRTMAPRPSEFSSASEWLEIIQSMPNVLVSDAVSSLGFDSYEELADAKFATGGIVTDKMLGLIGEGGDDEAVLPLDRLQNMIDMSGESAIENAATEIGEAGGTGGSGSIVVEISGNQEGEGLNDQDLRDALKGEVGSSLDALESTMDDLLREIKRGDLVGPIEITADGKVIAEVSEDGKDKYERAREVTK